MIKLKVIIYNHVADYFTCITEDGKQIQVDLLTDNNQIASDPISLIGKIVECENLHPFLYIAMQVKVLS